LSRTWPANRASFLNVLHAGRETIPDKPAETICCIDQRRFIDDLGPDIMSASHMHHCSLEGVRYILGSIRWRY
jgi:hypothetical protein